MIISPMGPAPDTTPPAAMAKPATSLNNARKLLKLADQEAAAVLGGSTANALRHLDAAMDASYAAGYMLKELPFDSAGEYALQGWEHLYSAQIALKQGTPIAQYVTNCVNWGREDLDVARTAIQNPD